MTAANPPTTAPAPYHLLQITFCKTANPTVSRVLSVPAGMSMKELRGAIAAAVDWSMSDGSKPSWVSRVVGEDPLLCSDPANLLQPPDCVFDTSSREEYGPLPGSSGTLCSVQRFLQRHRLGRFFTYDCDISQYRHAIEVIGTSDRDSERKLACLAGQGHIKRKAWQFGPFGYVRQDTPLSLAPLRPRSVFDDFLESYNRARSSGI
ncbi:MAG: hypothetical protein ALECFALPRED_000749 [Alectoria fallacina]|uniref:Uncharacterized protein n=1 Tax=Alectoria fallacina TaxID=1903189 RepID=A0A8H3JAV4_9LECA|nr:MAG: hypothetical protein ALECFALPRED_000749 [Alectoria fallacina]